MEMCNREMVYLNHFQLYSTKNNLEYTESIEHTIMNIMNLFDHDYETKESSKKHVQIF